MVSGRHLDYYETQLQEVKKLYTCPKCFKKERNTGYFLVCDEDYGGCGTITDLRPQKKKVKRIRKHVN